jgi:hypothetical protein
MGYSNYPPASHPVRSAFQKDQSFGWLEGSVLGSGKLRGEGKAVVIGDASPIGQRLFEARQFTTGDQGRSRGMRRQEYGS